jgi:hypothetical protein
MVPLVTKLKALGIVLQGNLSWDAQAECVINKSTRLLSAFKFLRKYLTESQFLKAASANYYGSVYYACSVWFNNLKQIHKKKLTSFHFRLLRAAKKDYRMKFKRYELTEACKRATPDQWTKFITASRVIKIVRDQQPSILHALLTENYFEERRQYGVGYFFDTSRVKIGRQSLQNRILFMRSINYPWNAAPMSNDLIRIEMKRVFFPYMTANTPENDSNQNQNQN